MVMSPYKQAKEMYLKAGLSLKDFNNDIHLYAQSGYLYASPDCFALARPVSTEWREDVIKLIELENTLSDNDLTKSLNCWYIAHVIGELSSLLNHIPYDLPFIAMERRGKFKVYDYNKIKQTN